MLGKRKTRLTADGWYYVTIMAFLVAGALLRDINLLLLVFGLMMAALVWHWRYSAGALKKLHFRRRLPRRVEAGEPLTIDLVAHNGRRRGAAWAIVVEDAVWREDGTGPQMKVKAAFSRVGPREDVLQTYRGQLTQRGRYVLGPLSVTTRFPLGLVRRTVAIDSSETLIVVPRLGRLTARWQQHQRELADGSDRAANQHGTSDGDFHSLRPYRSGDSRRLIHWRTSARQAQLMVRQFERRQTRDLAVVLDLWQPQRPTAAQRETVELAVSLTATLLADRCRQGGGRIFLGVSGAESSFLFGPTSSALLSQGIETLALATASPRDGLGSVLQRGLEQMPEHADAVLVSTRKLRTGHSSPFSSLAIDPRKRGRLDRMLILDASSDSILDYFEVDAPAAASGALRNGQGTITTTNDQ